MGGIARKIRRRLIKEGKLEKPLKNKVDILNEELSKASIDSNSPRLRQLHPMKGWRTHSIRRLYVATESRTAWWQQIAGVIMRARDKKRTDEIEGAKQLDAEVGT